MKFSLKFLANESWSGNMYGNHKFPNRKELPNTIACQNFRKCDEIFFGIAFVKKKFYSTIQDLLRADAYDEFKISSLRNRLGTFRDAAKGKFVSLRGRTSIFRDFDFERWYFKFGYEILYFFLFAFEKSWKVELILSHDLSEFFSHQYNSKKIVSPPFHRLWRSICVCFYVYIDISTAVLGL